MAVKFCVSWLKDNILLKETPSTVNSWVLVIFSRGRGAEVIFLLLWWMDYRFIRLIWVKFEVTSTGLQCFDAVGWAAGRASGL